MKKIPQSSKNLEYIDVPLEVKELDGDEDPDKFRFEGLASTFGNIDLVDDIILPGAFQESVARFMPKILWQHDRREPIGMPSEVREIPQGLFVIGELPRADTFVSGRVIPQMKIGTITTMSIGFRPVETSMNDNTGIRTLIKVDLREFSLVTFEANPLALISGFKNLDFDEQSKKELLQEIIKALGGNLKPYTLDNVKNLTTRQYEKLLRDSGLFSKDAAVMLASHIKDTGDPFSLSTAISQAQQTLDQATRSLSLKSINDKLENYHG